MAGTDVQTEWIKCSLSPDYFIHEYCYIYDAVKKDWIPFRLWKEQYEVLRTLQTDRLVIILKARQLGQTWLCLCYALHQCIFHPAATVLLFSRRDDEAVHLLSNRRLRGVYKRLPGWMHVRETPTDNNHEWTWSNGSAIYAFPTTAGDSYTASLAIVDEADLIPDLDFLMNAVKPTIDAGGQMVLLSRSNKEEPQSTFKRMYRAAVKGVNGWTPIFLPWWVHPGRDERWYERQEADILSRTGSYDDLWQQYPSTDEEALMPRTLDKRIPAPWLTQCLAELQPLEVHGLISVDPRIEVYHEPTPLREYVVGADPAEGNPTSDESALTVLDSSTGEEVACFSERVEPGLFGEIVYKVAKYFNDADILPERNNHGHVVIKVLTDYGDAKILPGLDGQPGWQTTGKSKAEMYSTAADSFKDKVTVIHSEDTFYQLSAVEGATLKAPEGEYDDRATSYALALQALAAPPQSSFAYEYMQHVRPSLSRRLRIADSVNMVVSR